MAGSEVEKALTGPESVPIERIAPWCVNNDEDDANTAKVECKAAETRAGAAHYLTHVTFSNNVVLADQSLVLLDDDDNIFFGPIDLMVEGDNTYSKDFKYPLKFPDNKGIFVQELVGGKASAVTVYLEGFTGDNPLG